MSPYLQFFGPRTAPLFKVPSLKNTFCARIYRFKLKLSVKFTVLIRYRTSEIERSSLGSPKNGTPNLATILEQLSYNPHRRLREGVDSFRSYLGFTSHVEPYVGSFPAIQNLHLPLGHAPIESIFTYSQIVVNLSTLFPG
jgi:hypothetical protein